ncbi:hypothetical protein ASPCAL12345 [Aspergillus calidoustus]|uniref:Uncharacterized protein n=1 Tax=Aspergillus calidoustus TaxID=454130 RepID=A0A0U5GBJ6_ASPCI|nr:hypothetical protein ASPCAL12345 [Aspergillus calidoustus]
MPWNVSIDQFTSNIQNSAQPVFLFLLSSFYVDFAPEIRRFAETHPHLNIYGIARPAFIRPNEHTDLILRLGVCAEAEFVLWRDGNNVVELQRPQLSNLMTVLQAMGV